jgi:hypothetical protein
LSQADFYFSSSKGDCCGFVLGQCCSVGVFPAHSFPTIENAAARVLLQAASAAIFAGMVFSSAYAVADFLGSDALTIPEMARTHGLLNAMGFCLCGFLGWLIDAQSREESRACFQS